MTATEVAPPPVEADVEEPEDATLCGPPAPVLSPDGPQSLPIAEAAERTGITAHTLRYYERIGLLDVPRDHAGRRWYTEAELARVVFITRLRLTAMPIRDIQAYFRLVDEGPGNEAERLTLLQRHRDQVKVRLGELQAAVDTIDFKIATYGGMCGP
ncbi:MAG TPA: MerR family transcriptional regulator [Acidimicrobiales bacterium]|jgi:DNA-binding transcriptional MerR regulator|nr:MerR family transcriptional regulator [Acidimicrobiales bacterium]